MSDREKIIKGLEHCMEGPVGCQKECPYKCDFGCRSTLARDALALLKRSFTPDEVYTTVIEHGQHDKRFRLGDAINYSFREAVEILRIELVRKAGDT